MSLALLHKRKVTAEKQDKQQSTVTLASNDRQQEKPLPAGKTDKFAVLKDSLQADLTTLKHANGDAERNPFKQELIEKYREYAESMMANHDNWSGQTVVFYWLIWRFDTEGFESVQQDWYRAIEHGLTTPQGFNRDWQTFYLDEVHNYSKSAFKEEREFNEDYLFGAIDALVKGEIVTNEALKSKLYVIAGKLAFKNEDWQKAAKYCQTALNLNPNAGVKTLLKEALEKAETDDKQANQDS